MTTAELTSLFNLFVEALGKLQSDKSEVQAATEALAAAQTALEKEVSDVGGSTTALNDAVVAVKNGIDALVATVIS